MLLYNLLDGITNTDLENFDVSEIISDNRKPISENSIFVCIKGENFDAHNVALQMLEKGVKAVVVERDLGIKNQIVVSDTRKALSLLWANWYDNPQRKLTLVGVTGTNGKTTVATTIKRLVMSQGKKCGLIGTCDVEIGDEIWQGTRSNPTTPDPEDLFRIFSDMVNAGCEYCVMEVSSQGLSQQRVYGCEYQVGIFTNLTQDHLDVHKTMENYFLAKSKLFEISKFKLSNIDDSYGKRLFDKTKDCLSFSDKENADYFAQNITLTPMGCEYDLCHESLKIPTKFAMPGEFNVSNSLVAVSTCHLLGFDLEGTANSLSKLEGVCGRAEVISKDVDFTVIRDYAHTPDAVEKILKSIREVSKGKITCVFGCGGNRDAKKRPIMAIAAAQNSDFCVVTSDNPRNEDPEEIIKDILAGMENQTTPFVKITDRRKAIEYALKNAKSGDVIAVVGKGHEDYQILKDNVKIHFDEKEIVEEILKDMKKC